MNPDSTLAVTNTCPKDGVHLWGHAVAFLDLVDGEVQYGRRR